MATIRAFTTVEQGRKLAEILPIESADMYYFRQIDDDYFPPNVESICPLPLFKDGKEDFNYDIRCWSLAALLGVLPKGYSLGRRTNGKYYVCMTNINHSISEFDNPVDACVTMVEKLHELKML